jgi:repressor LexA
MLRKDGTMMVRTRKGMTERHQKIMDFIIRRYDEGFPPSIREIGEAADISSTSVVTYYLKQLTEMGLIERDQKFSRAVRPVHVISKDLFRIPILGPVAAGLPIPVPDPQAAYIGDEINGVDVARSLLPEREKARDLFALKVQGDSMIDAMINDGDIVIIKSTIEARNGDMVAVWLPARDETTLKYFFKEKERYRLQPANPTMKPIFIEKNEPLEIKGKVVMVIRKLETTVA